MQQQGLTSRFVSTLRAAWHAWNARALVPLESWGWNSYEARQFRYYHAHAYYHNQVYSKLISYAEQHRFERGLYKKIRGIYNPVHRLVEIYVSKCYGGNLDMEHLKTGAIPLLGADKDLTEAIKMLWIWSNWGTQKSLFVRTGAINGDSPIKIVDDRKAGKVRMECLDPSKLKAMRVDEVGNIKEAIIEYEVDQDTDPSRPLDDFLFNNGIRHRSSYVYTEHITEDAFRTYKDGKEFAFYEDTSGRLVNSWENEYGFVPIVMAQHSNAGKMFGANSFWDFITKIDEINDSASLMNDQIRKLVVPIWWATGATGTETIDATVIEKDTVPIIYAPDGSEAKPMVANLQLAAALQNVQAMLMELERDMPELALHQLRAGGNLTAPGVNAGWGDAIGRLSEANANYDETMVRAHMMGVTVAAISGCKGFTMFDKFSYERGDLQHFIKERPIIHDVLSKKEQMDYMIAFQVPVEVGWKELGYSEEEIEAMRHLRESDPAMIEQRTTSAIALKAAGKNPDHVLKPMLEARTVTPKQPQAESQTG